MSGRYHKPCLVIIDDPAARNLDETGRERGCTLSDDPDPIGRTVRDTATNPDAMRWTPEPATHTHRSEELELAAGCCRIAVGDRVLYAGPIGEWST